MTFSPCFIRALCVAGALFLLPWTLRADGDPLKAIDGLNGPAEDTQGLQGNEIAAFTIAVPKTSGTLEASASLLILQPSSGNMVYGTLTNPFPFNSPHWEDEAVRTSFSPAFNIDMRYNLDGGGDIHLDWTHLNTYDKGFARVTAPLALGQLSGPSTVQALGPPFLIGPPVPYASVNAVAHFAYDAVNLEAELVLNIGSHVQVRSFAGAQWARINDNLTATFRSADGTLSFIDASKASFTGVGPRLGMELHYIAGSFDILGGIAGAALIGTRRSQFDFFANSPDNALLGLTPNMQTLTSPNSTQVIPCIDARLGASYTTSLGKFGIFRFEAGYQATVYINAINQYSLTEVENSLTADVPGTPETTGSSVFLRSAVESQSNFLVHGPYVRFSLQF